jgi:hypothetical protein
MKFQIVHGLKEKYLKKIGLRLLPHGEKKDGLEK